MCTAIVLNLVTDFHSWIYKFLQMSRKKCTHKNSLDGPGGKNKLFCVRIVLLWEKLARIFQSHRSDTHSQKLRAPLICTSKFSFVKTLFLSSVCLQGVANGQVLFSIFLLKIYFSFDLTPLFYLRMQWGCRNIGSATAL